MYPPCSPRLLGAEGVRDKGDEAQNPRPEVLSRLRLLANFEMDSKLVLFTLGSGNPVAQSSQ
jgi:hypothetical protein